MKKSSEKLRRTWNWYRTLIAISLSKKIYGNTSRRVEGIPLTNVIQAIALLKEETDYVRNIGNYTVYGVSIP